ncbi:uncharacterized protein (DUF1810 family) [Filimonas zeae]|uniref:DUF1810 domain-containing protein n=1 Tax=Filimonas zeae TaxID=1737353 RepID=A0A917IRJ0_9BACT|nr:DUF1810 domain-containing protein [Filimonas zeae]MDR6338105.1 uncharacterized protein (DUF1810 family) [Filimonas zeae]GGH61736.1 hypothetical protein GCM10011379_11020 [Filimonas zeae]
MTLHEKYNLQRFTDAQERDYITALNEIKGGRKRSHWMWYIFPQIHGLGRSDMAQRYAIKNLEEATAYLAHPVLGSRLIEISTALLALPGNNATHIMGSPDDIKLHSCMTLFAMVPGAPAVFSEVLVKFFGGKQDSGTLGLV